MPLSTSGTTQVPVAEGEAGPVDRIGPPTLPSMFLAQCQFVHGLVTQPPCHDVVRTPLWVPVVWTLVAVVIICAIVVGLRLFLRARLST
jgi:hypothetical protein